MGEAQACQEEGKKKHYYYYYVPEIMFAPIQATTEVADSKRGQIPNTKAVHSF